MKLPRLILIVSLAVFCGCAGLSERYARDVVVGRMDAVLPSDENQRSLWLSFSINTEESKFSSQTTKHWKQNYEVFSKALLEKAGNSSLDATSLAKILRDIFSDADGQYLACVPIAAYSTKLDGEPVWVVVLHWEPFFGREDPGPDRPLSHVRTYVYTQKDFKQVAFLTCG